MAEPRSLIDRHYQTFSAGNIDAGDEIFSADLVTIDPGAGEMHGLEAFKAYERGYLTGFADGQLQLRTAVESGNKIAVEGIFSGTHTGPLAGPTGEIPATNRRLELPFSEFCEVENGRIARHRLYYDQVTFLAQLGLMPGPEGGEQ